MTVISFRESASWVGYPPFTIDDALHVAPRSAPSMRDRRETVTVALDKPCDLRDEHCRIDREDYQLDIMIGEGPVAGRGADRARVIDQKCVMAIKNSGAHSEQ
jgi:hypothetical protein